jgi:hypothetical protein
MQKSTNLCLDSEKERDHLFNHFYKSIENVEKKLQCNFFLENLYSKIYFYVIIIGIFPIMIIIFDKNCIFMLL